MGNTGGAIALIGSEPQGAVIVDKVSLSERNGKSVAEHCFQLLEAGAIIFGKATMLVKLLLPIYS